MLYLVAHSFLNGQSKKLIFFPFPDLHETKFKKTRGALGTRMLHTRRNNMRAHVFSRAQSFRVKNATTFPFPILGIAPSVSGTLPVQNSSLFLFHNHAQAFRVEFVLRSPNVERANETYPSN